MDLTGRASELAQIMRIAYEKGYTTGAGGNASAKVDGGILITPSGKFKGGLKAEDIVMIDEDGRIIEGGRPSSEWRLHLMIYEKRPDVGAVLHCHHPLITGLVHSMLPTPLENPTLFPFSEEDWTEEARILLKEVRVVPWKPYGTEELAITVSEAMRDSNAVVIVRHGSVVVSKDPWSALAAMDSLAEIFTMKMVRLLLSH